MDKVKKKTLLQIITHHRQNPLDFTRPSVAKKAYELYKM
jgi:hypothetical protein